MSEEKQSRLIQQIIKQLELIYDNTNDRGIKSELETVIRLAKEEIGV